MELWALGPTMWFSKRLHLAPADELECFCQACGCQRRILLRVLVAFFARKSCMRPNLTKKTSLKATVHAAQLAFAHGNCGPPNCPSKPQSCFENLKLLVTMSRLVWRSARTFQLTPVSHPMSVSLKSTRPSET